MKKLPFLLFIFFASLASAQRIIKSEEVTDHSIHIVGDEFEGIVFKENYYQRPGDTTEAKIKRYTPSNEDIILTEQLLKNQTKNKTYNGDKKYIFNNLKKYHRQYIGYFDQNGDKSIYVNCFPNDEEWALVKAKDGNKALDIPKWYNTIFWVFDGGKPFWQMRINLKTGKIESFSINGVA
jgi:hypothetical protein